MKVLALDTSSRRRTVCLLADAEGSILDEQVAAAVPAGVAVPLALQRLLRLRPDALVVVTGPGSYTGLRAGLAAAAGVAQTRGLPLHGIGSLEVVAAGLERAQGAPEVVAADAGRGGAYVARCARRGPGWALDAPARQTLEALAGGAVRVASSDELPIPGLERVDPVRALARAVPLALATRPLPLSGLTAVYVDRQ